MTKDTKEYDGKGQKWFTRSTWTETRDEIQEGYKEGKVINGICYSTGLEQYLVVMTKMPQRQSYRLFGKTEKQAFSDWEHEKFEQGFHPTIIFEHPTENLTLSVMTEDENRSDYVRRRRHKLR